METKDWKRISVKVVPAAKTIKDGVRGQLRKKRNVNALYSIIAAGSAIREARKALLPYILGNPITQEAKKAAFSHTAAALRHLTVVARMFKTKVPSAHKKVKPHGTMLEIFSALETHVGNLEDAVVVQAVQGLGTIQPQANDAVTGALLEIQHLGWGMWEAPLSNLMEHEVQNLKSIYPAEVFVAPPKKAAPKNLPTKKAKAPQAAVVAATAVKPKAGKAAKA